MVGLQSRQLTTCMRCSFKSTVAAAAAQVINPAMNVRALQNRVSPETEDVFNDGFWEVMPSVRMHRALSASVRPRHHVLC